MLNKLVSIPLALAACLSMTIIAALAAPPVRIAVVCGGGSGIEQEIVDRISNNLSSNSDIVLSTVNPDWYVTCNINENIDQASGAVRYNGSVIVKTAGGHVISTKAVQKYNQDFSLSPGAPLNKKLVDNAAREVISSAADRCCPTCNKRSWSKWRRAIALLKLKAWPKPIITVMPSSCSRP